MILTDGTTTYSNAEEEIDEDYIWNQNISVTIGGVVKQQIDSNRLKIKSFFVIKQSDYLTLQSILTNYDATLTYTPARLLAGRATIAPLTVVLTGQDVTRRAWDGSEVVLYMTLTFDEVI